MLDFPPSRLTDEELVRYARLFLSKETPLPVAWVEELLKRLEATLDDLR